MKAILFALFVGLLMVGCGEPDLDDPETLQEIIASAVDRKNLNFESKIAEIEKQKLLYFLDTDSPYTGWAKLYHDNGKIRTLAQFKDGKSDGPVISWYENGKKEGKGYFENGFMEGVWTSWNKTGQKEQEGGYKNGLKDGRWMSWNADGKEEWNDTYNLYDTGEYYHGIWSKANAIIRYRYQYDSSWFETTWKNGQKDGPTTVWTNYYHEYARLEVGGGDYEDGQWAKFFSKTFDAETANKSAQNGPFRFCSGIYERGKREGIWTWYYALEKGNAKLAQETYKNGVPHGRATIWFRNGKKGLERQYKDGKLDGLLIFYREDGTEYLRETYKDGELVED